MHKNLLRNWTKQIYQIVKDVPGMRRGHKNEHKKFDVTENKVISQLASNFSKFVSLKKNDNRK